VPRGVRVRVSPPVQ